MINIAVCDDDIALLKAKLDPLIKRTLTKLEVQAEIQYYNNGLALLDDFKKQNIYDIVILDIDMPSINGKELARNLRAIDSEFTLAFFTAYENEVFSAIPIGISAFIPKNFDDDKILSSLSELLEAFLAKNPQYDTLDVLIEGKPSVIKIQASNIYYFLLTSKMITVHTYNDIYILSERKFDNVVKRFLPNGFYQINRACIVNVAKVYEIIDDSITMDNGDKLLVSRRTRKGLVRAVTLLPTMKVVQNGNANFRV